MHQEIRPFTISCIKKDSGISISLFRSYRGLLSEMDRSFRKLNGKVLFFTLREYKLSVKNHP